MQFFIEVITTLTLIFMGGHCLSEVIKDFNQKKYLWCGCDIMLSIAFIACLFKLIFQG